MRSCQTGSGNGSAETAIDSLALEVGSHKAQNRCQSHTLRSVQSSLRFASSRRSRTISPCTCCCHCSRPCPADVQASGGDKALHFNTCNEVSPTRLACMLGIDVSPGAQHMGTESWLHTELGCSLAGVGARGGLNAREPPKIRGGGLMARGLT